jgi:hypothetical protein
MRAPNAAMVAAVAALAAVGACDAPDPSTHATPVAEPTEALRPEPERGRVPEEAHVVDYVLDARLDTATHSVEGRARVTWRNRTTHPTDVLPMHLYMNAFRAEDTTWMRHGRGTHRGQGQDRESPWGYIDVRSVTRDGEPLEWSEGSDPTVMTVQLPEPVPGGGQVTVELDFETVLPAVFARTGHADDFYMVAQWFPKVGVLENDGTWQNHVFTFHSEFYADFGDYEVHLDVPAEMVVGATGIRTDEQVESGRKKITYRAQMVHDFAWTAWSGFVQTWAEHEGIRIRQLMPRERLGDASAHIDAVVATLDSMQPRFGQYPWSTITVVHPPPGAGGAAGMEYPTLFTAGDRVAIPSLVRRLGFDERVSGTFVTVHELGHQWFQGLLASNEHAQPWLDEGLNTMSNALVLMDRHQDDDPWLVRVAGQPLRLSDGMRLDMRRSGGLDPVDQPADAFSPLLGTYGGVVYRRTAALMLTLRNLAGAEAFDEALRTYAERWRFRHPTGADLEDVLVEILGRRVPLAEVHPELPGSGPVSLDVREFLDQGLRTTREVDFAVREVTNRAATGDAGWHRDESGALVGGAAPSRDPVRALPDDRVEGIVVVQRTGDFLVPVELEVEFADGSRTRVFWDGRARYTTLRFAGRRVTRVGIDPDRTLLLELDRSNNNRWAPGHEAGDPIARSVAGFGQAASLAVLGGLGP